MALKVLEQIWYFHVDIDQSNHSYVLQAVSSKKWV